MAELQLDLPGLVPHIRDRIYGAIAAGRLARSAGVPITENPHTARTYFWFLWRQGWLFDVD